MSTVVLASKLRAETIVVDVDVSSRLAVGETALTVASNIEVLTGVDATPATMLSGAPTVVNNIARQRVIGGLPGVVYQITFAVRTSNAQILLFRGKIAVLTSATVSPP